MRRSFDRDALFRGKLLYVSAENPLPADLPVQQSRDVRSLVGLYIPAAAHVSLSEETIYALCDLTAQNPFAVHLDHGGHALARGAGRPAKGRLFRLPIHFARCRGPAKRPQREIPDSGRSEHQLATSFDLRLDGAQDWSQPDPMARTADGRWLLETGIANEALHWRYVGRLHARMMHTADWCLEEYLQALHTYGVLRLQTSQGASAWVVCQPMEDAVGFSIPQGAECAVSADNLGWAVCAYEADQSSF